MVFGNVLRNGTYPISVSSERIFQALAIARYANEIGADAIAHGSTGAGNDQIRFDMTFLVLAPNVEIITLTRDMALSRQIHVERTVAKGHRTYSQTDGRSGQKNGFHRSGTISGRAYKTRRFISKNNHDYLNL